MALRHDPTDNIVPIRGSFEIELQLIREAIAMVATGKSRRVTLAGIHHAAPLLERAQRLADDAGVEVTPLQRAGGLGTDLAVGRPSA